MKTKKMDFVRDLCRRHLEEPYDEQSEALARLVDHVLDAIEEGIKPIDRLDRTVTTLAKVMDEQHSTIVALKRRVAELEKEIGLRKNNASALFKGQSGKNT